MNECALKNAHRITAVAPGSIGEEMGIEAGDALLAINDQEVTDIFDYRFLIQDDYIEALVRRADGEEWVLEIEKDFDEDLGLTFENGLMSDYRSCSNRCLFCFIDQMPPGMRDTLYFKDDDSRLSFLQGNYITLTNMGDRDIDRIVRLQMAPINISVHTTNPALRCRMLGNRFAGEKLRYLKTLYSHQVPMNGQIVCCKGLNDGEELRRTIADLAALQPWMASLSVVPAGSPGSGRGSPSLQPSQPKKPAPSSTWQRASRRKAWPGTAATSSTPATSGTSRPAGPSPRPPATTATSSWKTAWA